MDTDAPAAPADDTRGAAPAAAPAPAGGADETDAPEDDEEVDDGSGGMSSLTDEEINNIANSTPTPAPGAEDGAAAPAETAAEPNGSEDKVTAALKQVAMTAVQESDPDTLRKVADALAALSNAAPATPAAPELPAAEPISSEPVTKCDGAKGTAGMKAIAESDGPAVNAELSGDDTEPVIGAEDEEDEDEDEEGECPCADDIKAKYGLGSDVDLKELIHDLIRMKAEHEAAESPEEEKAEHLPGGEEEEEGEGDESPAEEAKEGEPAEVKEKVTIVAPEVPDHMHEGDKPKSFRDLLNMHKSAQCGIDGKPAIEKCDSKVPIEKTLTPEERKAGAEAAQKWKAEHDDPAKAAEEQKKRDEMSAQAKKVHEILEPYKTGRTEWGKPVSGMPTDAEKALHKSASETPESKHIATLAEAKAAIQKSTEASRPDSVATVNGDIERPRLDNIEKSALPPKVKMGRGVDPHKVVENDIARYNLFKSQKEF
jgi:hypothetical protein